MSEWTLETLKEYLQLRVDGLEKLLEERHTAAQAAVRSALSSAKEAVDKAEAALKERLAAMNEFRDQQRDLIQNFLTRSEYEGKHASLVEKYETLSTRVDGIELRFSSRLDITQGSDNRAKQGSAQFAQWVVIAILLIGLIVTIVVAIL